MAKTKATPKKKKTPFPAKYTASTMIQYIADKHDIDKKKSKELLDDVFGMITAGAMKGERVPVGKLGKVYVSVKPARKARMGRNPATGEEIKIAAKRATKVPKFTFSKTFKESVLKARIPKKADA